MVSAIAEKRRYSTSWMTSSIGLARATFYRLRGAARAGRDAGRRKAIREISAENPEFGRRRVKNGLEQSGGGLAGRPEKRIRLIMREERLRPPRRRKRSRCSSYDARLDNGEGIPNVPLKEGDTHDFRPDAPNTLWASDVTEFLLPSDERVFLSPVLDCLDSSPLGWRMSTSEKADELTNPSLRQASLSLRGGEGCRARTDRGGQHFSAGWIAICEEHGMRRSMSRKGCSPDNARMGGFFGRLKMELFDTRDWKGVGVERFVEELDGWLRCHNEERAKQSLGWLDPMQYRRRYYSA